MQRTLQQAHLQGKVGGLENSTRHLFETLYMERVKLISTL